MKKIYFLFLTVVTLFLSSCTDDFLDVSKELAEQRSYESIFSSPEDTRRWLMDSYHGIPDVSNVFGANGYGNPWPILADELDQNAQSTDWNIEQVTSSFFRGNRWNNYWLYIRQINIFLERAQVIPMSGETDYIDEVEYDYLKAQARFLRAYYHFLLFELYGPIPIVDYVESPTNTNIDFSRNSVDEVVDFIYNELTDIANRLKDPNLTDESTLAFPTKGTALALRAKLMTFAASPLFNGGYNDALRLTNTDGKRLFPDYDASKWQKALDACQAFIDYANAGHYELFKIVDENGSIDADRSLYELHNSFNKEVIFARSSVGWGNVTGPSGFDGLHIPRGVRSGNQNTGHLSVLQELVDDFFVIDRLSIEESPLYSEAGFTESADEDLTGNTEAGTFRMYINREPRFYQNVFYNGRRWHVGDEQVWFNKGGNSDNSSPNHVKTGYLSYKKVHRSVYNQGTHPKSMYRPGILMRLAEFYLLYAEALNEVNPSDPRVLTYIDYVRERAGIPLLADIKPQIRGNKELQREAIVAERRVELASEGQRYFDIRRWMIAGDGAGNGGQGGVFHGMDMDAETLADFYTRTEVETRRWDNSMYFAPIPLNEMQNSRMLVQNPGY